MEGITRCERVNLLNFDGEHIQEKLRIAARFLDGESDVSFDKALRHFRLASDDLAKYVYRHCDSLSDEEKNWKQKTNEYFTQFEKAVGTRDAATQKALARCREEIVWLSNTQAHSTRATEFDLRKGFDALIDYIGTWITSAAPTSRRKDTRFKAKEVPAVEQYRLRAIERLQAVLGDIKPDWLIPREIEYAVANHCDSEHGEETADSNSQEQSRGNDSEPDDRFATVLDIGADLLRSRTDLALMGKVSLVDVITHEKFALLVGDAGMGKSVEAAMAAIKLTQIAGGTVSCGICIQAFHITHEDHGIEDAFRARGTVALPFQEFVSEARWRRYLIVDGLDEAHDLAIVGRAIKNFRSKYAAVQLMVTSRPTSACLAEFPDWPRYELLPLPMEAWREYLRERLANKASADDLRLQTEEIRIRDDVQDLLSVPFFLNACVQTYEQDRGLSAISKVALTTRYIALLLRRHRDKNRQSYDSGVFIDFVQKLAETAYEQKILNVKRSIESLRRFGLLVDDQGEFKVEQVSSYLVARHILGSPTERWTGLATLSDSSRYEIHGWVLDFINSGRQDYEERISEECKRRALELLWKEDPLLVAVGLHDEERFSGLPTRETPWEPYEAGLIRLMRGGDPKRIVEYEEISKVRLCSPGEKFLHRLRNGDLEYFLRSVPERRNVRRLLKAWQEASEPWSELAAGFPVTASEWIRESFVGAEEILAKALSLKVASRYSDIANDLPSISPEVYPDDLLVRVLTLLGVVRRAEREDLDAARAVRKAESKLVNELKKRALSPRLTNRVIVNCENGAITRDVGLAVYLRKSICKGGGLRSVRNLSKVYKRSLVPELIALAGEGDNDSGLRRNVEDIWRRIVASYRVHEIAPITMAQAIYARLASADQLEGEAWYSEWKEHWVPRLSPYEVTTLVGKGLSFEHEPPGLRDAKGWLDVRDACLLKSMASAGRADFWVTEHTDEQKKWWVGSLPARRLKKLIDVGILRRREDAHLFQRAVERLEATLSPGTYWPLVVSGKISIDDIPRTYERLKRAVHDEPEAYLLLAQAGLWESRRPSQQVVEAAADCRCSAETKAQLVRCGYIDVEAYWKWESRWVTERLDLLNARAHSESHSDEWLWGRETPGQLFSLVYRTTADGDLRIEHPFVSWNIGCRSRRTKDRLRHTAAREQWHDGQVFLGLLGFRFAIDGSPEIVLAEMRSNFKSLGVSHCDGQRLVTQVVNR